MSDSRDFVISGPIGKDKAIAFFNSPPRLEINTPDTSLTLSAAEAVQVFDALRSRLQWLKREACL